MTVKFKAKYGKNRLTIQLFDGTEISTEFFAKYGKNVVRFATTDELTVEFYLRYGETEIEIPITENTKAYRIGKGNLIDLWKSKVTIFNDITPRSDGESRRFDCYVIGLCNVQGGYVSKVDGTIQSIANAQTVITKDVEHYMPPAEYKKLSSDERENYYTVQVGDFVVFAEVGDSVTDAKEFADLQKKYKNNGIKITSVSANIFGMAVDNVTMTNA